MDRYSHWVEGDSSMSISILMGVPVAKPRFQDGDPIPSEPEVVGTLWAWGQNGEGELGVGDKVNRSSPTQVGTADTWVSVAGGGYSATGLNTEGWTIFLRNDGTIWYCGSGNQASALITDTTADRTTPEQVGTDTDWAKLASSNMSILAVKENGTLWAWGANSEGQLGLGDTTDRSSPTQVGALTDWDKIAGTGRGGMAAIKTDGTLWTWGKNAAGELGQGDTVDRSSPTQVGTLTDWAEIVGAAWGQFENNNSGSILALKTDGTLWSWGRNHEGQLGLGDTTNRSSPTQIGAEIDWDKIAYAFSTGIAIKKDGTLWTWGYNNFGTMGVGDTTSRSSPVQVGTETDWTNIGANYVSAFGIRGGALYAWGHNGHGTLGLGDTTNRSSPTQVGAETDWVAVNGADGIEGFHTLAIRST